MSLLSTMTSAGDLKEKKQMSDLATALGEITVNFLGLKS